MKSPAFPTMTKSSFYNNPGEVMDTYTQKRETPDYYV
jgi:hypothetical protein